METKVFFVVSSIESGIPEAALFGYSNGLAIWHSLPDIRHIHVLKSIMDSSRPF